MKDIESCQDQDLEHLLSVIKRTHAELIFEKQRRAESLKYKAPDLKLVGEED